MATLPVLAIGLDRHWRARMQRLLAARGELDWLGAFAPAERRPSHVGAAALLLLDGDDATIERDCRRPRLPAPLRLYFYRQPTVPKLLRCIAARACACLEKVAPPDTVLRAIRAAESGLFVTAPTLLEQALRGGDLACVALTQPGVLTGDWSALTARQCEIVGWAAQGMSNKQIARQLDISPETVKSHLKHAFERGGVHNRIELMAARAPLRGSRAQADPALRPT